METKFKLAIYVAIVAFCLATPSATAQWQTPISSGDVWTQVNPASNAQSIGIGDFDGNSVVPQSALHINTNSSFLPASPTFNAGEVFRTDAPNSQSGDDTYWRMLHGGTQVFNINNPYNSNNVALGTVQSGNLNFFTNNTQKATILANGNVGIGTSAPAYTLQVNGTIAARQILVETNAETKDLLALVTQLQLEVEDLKQKLRCVAENNFVNSENR